MYTKKRYWNHSRKQTSFQRGYKVDSDTGRYQCAGITWKPVNVNPKHAENIDPGEAEILTLAEPGNYDYIITDDVKAMPYMKSMTKVKVLTSAFVIRLLYDKGLLSRHEALNSIKVISQSRDWYGGVLETISNRYFNDL